MDDFLQFLILMEEEKIFDDAADADEEETDETPSYFHRYVEKF